MTLEVHAYAAARRGRPAGSRNRNGPVIVITVNRALWQHALRAANGDGSRIQIVNETTVIVRNKGRQA